MNQGNVCKYEWLVFHFLCNLRDNEYTQQMITISQLIPGRAYVQRTYYLIARVDIRLPLLGDISVFFFNFCFFPVYQFMHDLINCTRLNITCL